MERLWQKRGVKPEALRDQPIIEAKDIEFWTAFLALNACRQVGMSSFQKSSVVDIEAIAKICKLPVKDFLYIAIDLDGILIQWYTDKD